MSSSIAELAPRLDALDSPLDVPFAFASELELRRPAGPTHLLPLFAAFAQRFVLLCASDPLASPIHRGIARDQLLGVLLASGASREEQLIGRALLGAKSPADFAQRQRALLPDTPSLVPLELTAQPRGSSHLVLVSSLLLGLLLLLLLLSCAR